MIVHYSNRRHKSASSPLSCTVHTAFAKSLKCRAQNTHYVATVVAYATGETRCFRLAKLVTSPPLPMR